MFLAIGCGNSHVESIRSVEEFEPSNQPGTKQILDVAGTQFPVLLHYQNDNGRLRIKLDQANSTVDQEEYQESPAAFSLVEAEDTTYSPSLPLIQFPMNVGDSWSWRGTTASFGKSQSSSARISSSPSPLTVGQNVHNTVRIDVNIKLERPANATPLTRHLIFWFEPGQGLLQRDFGGMSIRRPVGP